jgi:SAM-dependent methyltransferase
VIPVCPLCGEEAHGETRFKGVFRCGRHGAFEWFDRRFLEDVDLIAAYQSYPYNRSVGNNFKQMKPAYVRGLKKRILSYRSTPHGLSFLDVGCANGEFLEAAWAIGMGPAAGVEIDEEAKKRAAAHGRVFSTMEEVQGQYDIVQCKNVLSNIANPMAFFASLLGKTKPDGILFLDVLNQFGLAALIKRALKRPGALRPPFVINGFSKRSVVELARRSNATVVRLGTTYAGSDLLPYRRTLALVARGWVSEKAGAASMITADIIPIRPDASKDV